MSRNILTIAFWEYSTRIKTKWFLISIFLLPAFFLLALVLPTMIVSTETGESAVLAIVDKSGAGVGEKISEYFHQRYKLDNGSPMYQIMVLRSGSYENTVEVAQSLLDSMVIDGYVVIPEDIFSAGKVRFYVRKSNFVLCARLEEVFDDVLIAARLEEYGIGLKEIAEITKGVELETIRITPRGEQKLSELDLFILPLVAFFILFLAIFNTSQSLMRGLIVERSSRLVEIILSSVTPGEFMTGKILGLGLLGLTQIIIYLLIGYYASSAKGLNIDFGYTIIVFAIYFVLGYLFYAAMFCTMGALFTSEYEAQHAMSIVSMLVVLPVIFSSYIVFNPDSIVTHIVSFIPIFTPFIMVLKAGMGFAPVWEVVGTSIILLIFVVLTIIIGSKVFRTAILMYGKRPTLPEILKWVGS
ncbi:MAG TPA: ABC transporter permease [Candidatus Marinimicrobia bacterium]|nr:ABC transporter permease [Candidatus Neomarinimicrobiota bacterium]